MTAKAELLKWIRLNCQECMCGPRACKGQTGHKVEDIEGCTCPECAFYPFRMGVDPWPNAKKVAQKKARFALRQSNERSLAKNKSTSTLNA